MNSNTSCFSTLLSSTRRVAKGKWPPPLDDLDDMVGTYISCISPHFKVNCKPPATLEFCISKSFNSNLDAVRIVGKAFDDVIDLLCFESVVDKPLPLQIFAVYVEFFHALRNYMPTLISNFEGIFSPVAELLNILRQYKLGAAVLANLIPVSESDFEKWHQLGSIFYYCGYVAFLWRNSSPDTHTRALIGFLGVTGVFFLEKIIISLRYYFGQINLSSQLVALMLRYFLVFRTKFVFVIIAPIIAIARIQLTGPLFICILADVFLYHLLCKTYSVAFHSSLVPSIEVDKKRGRPTKQKLLDPLAQDRFRKYLEFVGPRF